MKAKIIFDLDDPDDRLAHTRCSRCSKALDMAHALWSLQEFCINIIGRDTVTSEEVRDKFAEVCCKYGIEPDELVN